jgi:uncharacterized protein (TIGR02246 family)
MTSSNGTATLTEDELAIREVPKRMIAAWAGNDAVAFSKLFTTDGSMILPGVFVTGQDKILEFMTAAYAGPYRGTNVYGAPIGLKILGPGAVLLLTQGGVLAPGETEVAPERAIRASWNLVKRDGEWLVSAYQNTPISTP